MILILTFFKRYNLKFEKKIKIFNQKFLSKLISYLLIEFTIKQI